MRTFRHSEISDYYKCARFFELRHLLKLPTDAPDSSALFFGTALHLGVQSYFEGEDGAGVFEAAWEVHRGKPLTYYGRESWESLAKDGVQLLSRFDRLHRKHFEPAMIEQKLQREYKNGIGFSGTVDFIGKYKGVKSVCDWKTSGKRYPQEKLLVSEQLSGYNFMARGEPHKYEAEQHIYVVFRKTGVEGEAGIQVITEPANLDFVMSRVDNMYAVAEQISKQKLFTKNTGSCLMGKFKCDYFDKCYGKGSDEPA